MFYIIISIFIIISIWMKVPEGLFSNPNSQMPKLIILHLESELINFGRMGGCYCYQYEDPLGKVDRPVWYAHQYSSSTNKIQ